MGKRLDLTIEERFWQRVRKSDGCWEWTGTRLPRGYGTFAPRRHGHCYAHRYSYELHHGPVPNGCVVMHLCDNPSCVRPDHLRAGTQSENLRDMHRKGRYTRVYAHKTHCPRGHAYSGDNVARQKSGYPICIACRRALDRKRRPVGSRARRTA